ncbi:MAG: FoF1 ATP synthase subunit gamma [Anaerolineae bacterium]|jgi:F-type H+-transporting ATPase subunit gamma
MEEIERAHERLDNIRGVKPILNGLRTISLGSWQAALKRRSSTRDYAERLEAMLPPLMPHLLAERPRLDGSLYGVKRSSARESTRASGTAGRAPDSGARRVTALVIGSERGLCGRFNVAVAGETERYLTKRSADEVRVNLEVLGSRAQRALSRRAVEAEQAGTLAVTTLPPLSLAFQLARRWLTAYEEGNIDAVDLIYNDYRGTGTYEPTVKRLIPPQLPTVDPSRTRLDVSTARPASFPPPIVDTDPLTLYARVAEQWTSVQLYNVLLDSSAAEHATRFQLMESATQNADELIEELTLVIQTARRQEITQEMAELAAGAGLLGVD